MTKRITPDLLLQHLQDECYAGRMTIVQSLWFEDAAQVWAAEQREREILRQNWHSCVEHAAQVEEERNRLRDLVDTIRDGMSEALLKSATAGADGTGLYTDAAAAVAFGDIAVSWIEEQEALAATTDSQANPEEKRDD